MNEWVNIVVILLYANWSWTMI